MPTLQDFNHGSTYLEIIGQVMDERTLKMAQYVNLGDDVGESRVVEAANHERGSARGAQT